MYVTHVNIVEFNKIKKFMFSIALGKQMWYLFIRSYVDVSNNIFQMIGIRFYDFIVYASWYTPQKSYHSYAGFLLLFRTFHRPTATITPLIYTPMSTLHLVYLPNAQKGDMKY